MWITAEQILGIKAGFDGLTVEPHLPEDWDFAKATKLFRGAEYNITIRRTGSRSITVNGNAAGALLPYEEGAVFDVDVTV